MYSDILIGKNVKYAMQPSPPKQPSSSTHFVDSNQSVPQKQSKNPIRFDAKALADVTIMKQTEHGIEDRETLDDPNKNGLPTRPDNTSQLKQTQEQPAMNSNTATSFKKPRLEELEMDEWKSIQSICEESWQKMKEIEDSNKKRFEQKIIKMEQEIADLRKINIGLKDEMDALKLQKTQLCCSNCEAPVEKVVYCTEKCHETAIQKRLKLQQDLQQ